MSKSMYEKLGIDPDKSNVREIFSKIVDNHYPNAFVNIVHDQQYPGMVFTQHNDGDGSKFVQRMLYYLEKKDATIFQGCVDDGFAMNTGDIAASGFVFGKWVLTQIININGFNTPKEEIMRQIALRDATLLELYRQHGFNMTFFLGGETADLPDQTKTAIYDVCLYAREWEGNIIAGNIKPGDMIYGFASDGKALWEDEYNSGIMSNGLTMGRIKLMHQHYGEKYPFLIRDGGHFEGRFLVDEKPRLLRGLTVCQALLAPTRQWALVIRMIIEKLKARKMLHMLHGISMNTGGGATKIRHIGQGIIYEKEMPIPPAIFQLIQAESGESWRNMYKTFNCGVGIDVVGENHPEFNAVLQEVSYSTDIDLFVLGQCKRSRNKKNKIVLKTQHGVFNDY